MCRKMKKYQVGKVYQVKQMPKIELKKGQQLIKWCLVLKERYERYGFVIIKEGWRFQGTFFYHERYLYIPCCDSINIVTVNRRDKKVTVKRKE